MSICNETLFWVNAVISSELIASCRVVYGIEIDIK